MFSYFLLPNKSSADIDTYIQPLFDLPSIMTSKNGQNIKSLKVSHVRYQIIGFWELQIPFWYPFWPQMILEAFNLQILMTSWGQNMKSMKMSHMRFQIIGFFVFWFYFGTPFGTGIVLMVADLQISMIFVSLRIKSMKMGHFIYQIIVFLNPIFNFFWIWE